MRLSDQIDLLRKTLEEFGGVAEGESVGEAAVRVIGQCQAALKLADDADEAAFQAATQSDKDYIAELKARIAELEDAKPSTDGLCDSCSYLDNTKHIPRLCQSEEAIRQGFSRRGYSVAANYGCPEWT